ncbi:MAG: hypothetical protein KJ558_06985 [Gammaproteobacteria bacterium]|nr:hypothetical protein [Gammaproteobacteria bacterium]MBU1654563.1 hypothetical protein [Gammaproteobacteria bacterium]MBU1961955.1 hypothetical protein [Gammaproteobacteria bacterium]
MKSRAFVCDPVCALPYGHNVVGLKYFSDAIRPFFGGIIPIASRSLLEKISLDYGFEREFDFYYHKHIKVGEAEDSNLSADLSQRLGGDAMLERAMRDVDNIFTKYAISAMDSVVFPCVDYYGAMGLLSILRKLKPENAPSVYFRFIGVMESATMHGGNGLIILSKKIATALKDGYKIRLSAETPAYADHLAEVLGVAVSVVTFPVHTDVARSNSHLKPDNEVEVLKDDHRIFNVACPGSARVDKGYLSLLEIFSNFRRHDPRLTIKFVTQMLPISEALPYANYTNQLYAIPGVRLLPSAVTEDEMNALYKYSDLVLLPYDPTVYAYRGSAVFMECISRGIPVIGLAGAAFCKQIDYYGAGSVVSSICEFTEHIFRYRDMSARSISIGMLQARHRYAVDSASAITHWIAQ